MEDVNTAPFVGDTVPIYFARTQSGEVESETRLAGIFTCLVFGDAVMSPRVPWKVPTPWQIVDALDGANNGVHAS